MDDQSYSRQSFNTINRYKHQAVYDFYAIHSVVNSAAVVHVSFVPDAEEPFPTILPMIGQMGSFERPNSGLGEELDCYLHGYVSSRIMRLACEAARRGDEGLPVCAAASKVDGLVLSLTPNTHNYNYRSVVLHGYASVVQNDEERLFAMELVTNSVVTGRWHSTRVPPDGAEMQSTNILKVKVVAGSGKVREGVPEDEKKDLKRDDVLNTVWTGVIPVWEKYGEPVPGPYNRIPQPPTHVRDFVTHSNSKNEHYATQAASKPAPPKRKKRSEDE